MTKADMRNTLTNASRFGRGIVHLAGLLLLLGSGKLQAQYEWDSTWTAALSGPLRLDQITMVKSAGSYYSLTRAKVTLAEPRSVHSIEVEGSMGNMMSALKLSPGLNYNSPTVNYLHPWFCSPKAKEADGSLKWLLQAYLHLEDTEDLLHERRMHYTPLWEEGPPKMPTSYSIPIGGDTVKTLMRKLALGFDSRREQFPDRTWLDYGGRIHKGSGGMTAAPMTEPKCVQRHTGGALYQTSHGVIWSDGKRHTWCFVSEYMTNGPNKLRWHSIEHALEKDGLIYILQNSAEFTHSLWVVDPVLGELLQINSQWLTGWNSETDGPQPAQIKASMGMVYLVDSSGELPASKVIPIDMIQAAMKAKQD